MKIRISILSQFAVFIIIILAELCTNTNSELCPVYSEFAAYVPINSEVFACSEDNFMGDWEYFTGQVSVKCKSSLDVVNILYEINAQKTSSVFIILLNFLNISETIAALKEISFFHSIESKLNAPINIFIPCNSPMDFVNLLQLQHIKLPWTAAVFVLETDALFTVWELITARNSYFKQEVNWENLTKAMHSRFGRENMHGKVLRALAIDSMDEQFSAKFETKDNGKIAFAENGYSVRLLHDLRDSLNFTIHAIRGQEYITDQRVNNTVGGIGGQLINNEADLIITMSYALEFRVKYLSPTVAFSRDEIKVFFRQPSQNLERNIFLHPFQDLVWIVLMLTLVMILLLTFGLSKVQFHFRLRKTRNQSYIWILGALCQKSCQKLPRKSPGRILVVTTFFMSWVMYIFYSASIISRLSVSSTPIKSLMGLISANFKLLADPLVSYSKFLNIPMAEDWDKTFVNEMDSVEKIYNGGYGFISSLDLVAIAARNLGFREQDICEKLSHVPLNSLVMPLQFYTRKGYPYRELVNRKLLNSMGKGLNNRYQKEFLRKTSPVCLSLSTKTTYHKLGFTDLNSAFFALLLVYLLTAILLGTEKFISTVRERQTHKSTTIMMVIGKSETESESGVRPITQSQFVDSFQQQLFV